MLPFLLAYTCSGLAGLIYQVCWTRLLTLTIGHTTGAASAVVAAFLGGLAAGAVAGGKAATRLSPRRALFAYAALEVAVAVLALLVPLQIRALTPLLGWSYADGTSPILFPAMRLAACVAIVCVPAIALGATFPLAVRWIATRNSTRAQSGGALYAFNTAGAAAGAVLAGFVLIPRIGVSGATWIGVAASLAAALLVITIVPRDGATDTPDVATEPSAPRGPRRRASGNRSDAVEKEDSWLAPLVLGVTGFAALLHEIAWTRILTMVFGPTTYAFAATLATVITGIAAGSAMSAVLVRRTRQPAFWLAILTASAAATSIYTSSLAGGPVPMMVAEQIAREPNLFGALLWRGGLLTAALILPTSALLGAAFPLALAMVDDRARPASVPFARVYAVNTIGSVVGSLAAGFFFIPALGLESTLRLVALSLSLSAVVVVSFANLTRRLRAAGAAASALAVLLMFASSPWDRELLASGAYLYAPFVPPDLPLRPMLTAGQLLYYREGAAATVSVKRLTGTNTLAVDGKTDASNRGDMLTQKLVAHLPLLLHENPRHVGIIGLGSGVTAGAALRHPIARAEVIELSPEVVAASTFFAAENRRALADARTRVLVADGRSHLQLSTTSYDVIVSEPSNPWIAGVAALFTREFFAAARDRLAPGGIICQWANAYNISDRDLRAIVATFLSVFPHGSAWLVGGDDVLLIASQESLENRLGNIARHWHRPEVADDLRQSGAVEPFALWSLFVAGEAELRRYAADATVLTDDRMTLEFSAPRELGSRRPGSNSATLRALVASPTLPGVIQEARNGASAVQWRQRAAMMAGRDAFSDAFADYARALELDRHDIAAIDGLARMAILLRRPADALARLAEPQNGSDGSAAATLVARSRLLAASGRRADAVAAARRALDLPHGEPAALEQLAAIHAEAGDVGELDPVVRRLHERVPARAATDYYAAVIAFLRGDAARALQSAGQALSRDPSYAAAHDLVGAAHARLGDPDRAREAFLASLRADAHDSTAYANLGVLALEAGERAAAVDYFAEALWLDADSALAREGLQRAMVAY